MTQVLIAHQATVNAVNHWNLTPLATAVISNQHAAAQLLREHGGALCSKMHRSFYPVHAATITGALIFFRRKFMQTYIHECVHTYICTDVRTYVRTYARAYRCTYHSHGCTHLLLAHAHALSCVMCLSSVISLCAHHICTQLQQSMSSSTTF